MSFGIMGHVSPYNFTEARRALSEPPEMEVFKHDLRAHFKCPSDEPCQACPCYSHCLSIYVFGDDEE